MELKWACTVPSWTRRNPLDYTINEGFYTYRDNTNVDVDLKLSAVGKSGDARRSGANRGDSEPNNNDGDGQGNTKTTGASESGQRLDEPLLRSAKSPVQFLAAPAEAKFVHTAIFANHVRLLRDRVDFSVLRSPFFPARAAFSSRLSRAKRLRGKRVLLGSGHVLRSVTPYSCAQKVPTLLKAAPRCRISHLLLCRGEAHSRSCRYCPENAPDILQRTCSAQTAPHLTSMLTVPNEKYLVAHVYVHQHACFIINRNMGKARRSKSWQVDAGVTTGRVRVSTAATLGKYPFSFTIPGMP